MLPTSGKVSGTMQACLLMLVWPLAHAFGSCPSASKLGGCFEDLLSTEGDTRVKAAGGLSALVENLLGATGQPEEDAGDEEKFHMEQRALVEVVRLLGEEVSALPPWVQKVADVAERSVPEAVLAKDSGAIVGRRASEFHDPDFAAKQTDVSDDPAYYSWYYINVSIGPKTDAQLLEDCEDDMYLEYISRFGVGYSTGCDMFRYENCATSSANISMTRCPMSCGMCEMQGYHSNANQLERCEDHPRYISITPVGTNMLFMGCEKMANKGNCEQETDYPYNIQNVRANLSAWVRKMCPRQCGVCSKCGAGTMWDTTKLDNDPDFCMPCDAGWYSPVNDSRTCSFCRAGTFTALPGTSICTPCSLGQYQNLSSQSSCNSCNTDKAFPEFWTTMSYGLTGVGDEKDYFLTDGSIDEADCGCKKGYRLNDNDECVKCPEGVICDGMTTKGNVQVKEGFYSAQGDEFFTYKCQENPLRCPGGPPGSCASGRDNTTLACGKCKSGSRAVANGGCVDCTSGDVWPFVALALFAIAAVAAMYVVVNMETRAKMKTSSLLISVSIGLIVSVFQQLKVFSLMSFYWPEPFRTFLRFTTIFGFDLELVKFACVIEVSPVVGFSMKLVNIAVLLGVISLIHLGYVLVKGGFKENIHFLTNSYGTLFFAFSTAIASLTFSPFACLSHPNGEVLTMQGYPTVKCFDPAGQHGSMVAIGVVATLALLLCVTLCGVAVFFYTSSMRHGNTYFLQMYAFLFSRFRVGAQYWGIVCLLRGLFVALMPVLPNVLAQCTLMLCLLLYSTTTMYILPWRLLTSNLLDVGVSVCLICVLSLALFFAEKPDITLVSQFCCALFGIAVSTVGIAVCYGFYKHFLRKQMQFRFFICHHKGGAGAFARLLKTHLLENTKVTSGVFLDSDDLQDLNKLFEFVREELDTLVVVCTKELMTRPWCAGELTTARLNNVPLVLVLLPDFSFPDENLINNYMQHVPGTSTLAPHGISEAMVQETLRWISSNPTIKFPNTVNMKIMDTLCGHLFKPPEGVVTISDEGNPHSKSKCESVILVDSTYAEAIATAFVLEKLILPFVGSESEKLPRVLSDSEDVPPAAKKVLVVCSNGCFQNPMLCKRIMQASENESYILPIVAEDAFRFPTSEFWDDMRKEGPTLMDQIGKDYDIEQLIEVIKGIFSEIAVAFHACDNSAADLKVRAGTVARRISNKTTMSSKSVKAMKVEDNVKDPEAAVQSQDEEPVRDGN